MRELLLGIIDFRRRLRPALLSTFQKMATSQKPNSLFIACADSRVVPNLFASTNPGELFSIRNVGNMIPPPNKLDMSESDESEMAAVEFSVSVLGVRNIILCGHSECGAMKAIMTQDSASSPVAATTPHLNSWLRHGFPALNKYNRYLSNMNDVPSFFNGNSSVPGFIDPSLPPQDQLSQVNVLQQVEHICRYRTVMDKIQKGEILIHAWWFDIANANIFSFSDRKGKFVLIDDAKAVEILERLGEHVTLQEIATKYDVSGQYAFRNPSWTEPFLASPAPKSDTNDSHPIANDVKNADGEKDGADKVVHSCCAHHGHNKQ